MDAMGARLTAHGIRVVRFEFPYMVRRRRGEGRPPPDRAPVLEACFREQVLAAGNPARLVIGGKSMGGRIATHVADELGVRGVVALGFPFVSPGTRSPERVTRLASLCTQALIVQGTRDPFGTESQLRGFALRASIALHFIEDGDHSLEPRKKSGRTLAQNLDAAAAAVADFVLTGRAACLPPAAR